MLEAIIAIFCGLILLAGFLPGKALKNFAGALNNIGGILGIVALILGVLGILGGFGWLALTLILAGILLGVRLIPSLSKAAAAIAPLGTIVGIAALVLGILALL